MRLLKNIVFLFSLFILVSSCRSSKVACPGSGQKKESDFALFDDEGKPLSKKKKKKSAKKNEVGLVNKKQPSNLKRRRKRSINDKPKL